MKKNILLTVVVVSILSLGLMACAPADTVLASSDTRRGPFGDPTDGDDTIVGQGYGTGIGMGYGQSGATMGTGIALTPLSDSEAADLIYAIQEEYNARALYEGVIASFGNTIPFSEIVVSEASHANALVRQAEKYGLEVSAYEGAASVSFSSLQEACQAGVDAEIADAALYDELMSATTRTDLLRVYSNLQSASLNSHLPQFEACN